MTTYREHVAGAQACLIEADATLGTEMPDVIGEYKADVIATAQVHATLAVAEQQRMANLLKIAAEGRHAMEKNAGESWPDIADALGIGDSNE